MPNSPVTGETMEKRLRELAHCGADGEFDSACHRCESQYQIARRAANIALEEAAKVAEAGLYWNIATAIRNLK